MPVDLVQHLVSTARIEVEGDVVQPGVAVAANQCVESAQLLSDGVFASGEQIDRQIAGILRSATGSYNRGATPRKETRESG